MKYNIEKNETHDRSCLICNARSLVQLDLQYDRRKGLPGFWSLYKCNECGMIAVYLSKTEVELSEYYSVYSQDKTVTFSLCGGSQYPLLRKLIHWISGAVDPGDFIKPGVDSTLLNYGCGETGCLFDFLSRGVNISGAEISSEMVNACKNAGLDVHQVTNPDNILFKKNAFDIVYLMQVFEHLLNPHVFLDELHRVLKSDGILLMAVPNSKSVLRKFF